LGGLGNIQAAYQAQLAYAECMRSHGVPSYPDPKLSAHAVSFSGMNSKTPQFTSASTACKKLVPDGGLPSEAQKQTTIAALLKYAKCMRAHGQPNFPDPVASNGGITIALGASTPVRRSTRQPRRAAASSPPALLGDAGEPQVGRSSGVR
jgi:hypothetical protein